MAPSVEMGAQRRNSLSYIGREKVNVACQLEIYFMYSSLVDMEVVSVFAFVSWKSDVFWCERGCGVKFPCSSQPDNQFSIRSMWKPLVLCLLVPLQSRIFLVSMFDYEGKSRLFVIKTADLYHIPIKTYWKTRQAPFILKWILVSWKMLVDH